MAGPDWSAFATAFLGDTAKYINERVDKASEYEDKLKEQAERNKLLLDKRNAVVTQAAGLAARAKSLGASEDMIKAAIDKGPNGLVELTGELDKIKLEYGDRWTPEVAAVHVGLPEGYKPAELNLSDYISRAYGVTPGEIGSTKAPEQGFFGRVMGMGGRERVRAAMDKDGYYKGYSVYDLSELSNQAEYQSLVQGAYFNTTAPKVFKPDEVATEKKLISAMLSNVEDTPAYAAASEAFTKAQKSLTGGNLLPDQRKAAEAEMAKQKAIMQGLRTAVLNDHVSTQTALYKHGGYLDYMGSYLDTIMGKGYTEGFMATTGVVKAADTGGVTEAVKPEVVVEVVEQAGGQVEIQDDELVVTAPSLPEGGVKFKTDNDGKIVEATTVINGEEYLLVGEDAIAVWTDIQNLNTGPGNIDISNVGADFSTTDKNNMPRLSPVLTTEEERQDILGQPLGKAKLEAAGIKQSAIGRMLQGLPSQEERDRRVAQIELKRAADPEAYYKVTVPGMNLNRPMRVKGSDIKFIPDEALAQGWNNPEIAEFGIDEDMPKKTWSGSSIRKTYKGFQPYQDVDVETADGAAPTESLRPKARGLMAKTDAKPAEAPAEEPAPEDAKQADAASEVLLKKHGRDMLEFLKERGITKDSDQADILYELSDWADTNKKILPFDKGAIVNLLQQALQKGL
jgi:hypothetical protein